MSTSKIFFVASQILNLMMTSIDLGYAFTYTGSGGRDLKGTKQNPKNLRTAPQTSHQSFDNPLNAALKVSLPANKQS